MVRFLQAPCTTYVSGNDVTMVLVIWINLGALRDLIYILPEDQDGRPLIMVGEGDKVGF